MHYNQKSDICHKNKAEKESGLKYFNFFVLLGGGKTRINVLLCEIQHP